MNRESIMECIGILSDEAPKLRDILNITQLEFAKIIGISRQSVIDF